MALTFNVRLRDLRNEWKLTQGELAEKTGIRRANLSHYEKGNRWPQVEGLVLLAEYFGVTVDYLLGLSDYRSYPKQDIYTIAGKLIIDIEEATNKAKNELAEADKSEKSKRSRKRLSVKRPAEQAVGSKDDGELVIGR